MVEAVAAGMKQEEGAAEEADKEEVAAAMNRAHRHSTIRITTANHKALMVEEAGAEAAVIKEDIKVVAKMTGAHIKDNHNAVATKVPNNQEAATRTITIREEGEVEEGAEDATTEHHHRRPRFRKTNIYSTRTHYTLI